MRVYEELFILKPDTVEEEVDGFVEQIQHVITNGKGTVDKTDKWGVRVGRLSALVLPPIAVTSA